MQCLIKGDNHLNQENRKLALTLYQRLHRLAFYAIISFSGSRSACIGVRWKYMFACVVFVWGHFSRKAFVVLVIGKTKRASRRAGMSTFQS